MHQDSKKNEYTEQEKQILHQDLSEIIKERDTLVKKNLLLTSQYKTCRQSTSYQLGHLLLHDTRSLRSLIAFPKRVFRIWKNNNKRTPLDLTSLKTQTSNPKPLKIDNLKTLKVACILDTFSFNVFAPEADLCQLTPQNWKHEIKECKPNMLFIESAWRGKDDLWRDKIHKLSQELVDIIVYCRKHGIPTVFWNKEDPYHFDDFIDMVQYFDFVFTTDINCVSQYKSELGHDNIFLLPFACQPKIHNPIEKFERKDAFVFAGAYYPHFPERMSVFEDFIKHLTTVGKIDIYDRHFGNTATSNIFPEEYTPLIRGTLAYHEIDKAYKGYKYAINLNSITTSPTMFSRRVFELMACNTLVLSNYAEGLPYLFGDLLIATDSGEMLVNKFLEITKTPIREKKIKLLALRKVLLEHTAENRFAYLASKVYHQKIEMSLPYISMVAYAKDKNALNAIIETYQRQTYSHKYLTIVLHSDLSALETNDINIQFINETDNTTFSTLSKNVAFVAGIVDVDYYGKNYLLDLALATHYSDAEIIGKKTYYCYTPDKGLVLENDGLSYHIVKSIAARSSIISKKDLASQKIVDWGQELSTHIYNNDNILSIDEFNYCKNTQYNVFSNKDIEFICDLNAINTGTDMDIVLQNA